MKRFNIYNLSKLLFQLGPSFFFDRATHLRLTLIIEFLALCHADLEFDPAVLPVNACDDERHSFLRGLLLEFLDLTAVEKQLSRAKDIVIVDVTVRIMRDMSTDQPDLAILYLDEGLFELDAACHDALDLGADKRRSGLVFIENVVLVVRESIINDVFFFGH